VRHKDKEQLTINVAATLNTGSMSFEKGTNIMRENRKISNLVEAMLTTHLKRGGFLKAQRRGKRSWLDVAIKAVA
jgi:cytochrome oxidase assembly protein ShyY1